MALIYVGTAAAAAIIISIKSICALVDLAIRYVFEWTSATPNWAIYRHVAAINGMIVGWRHDRR